MTFYGLNDNESGVCYVNNIIANRCVQMFRSSLYPLQSVSTLNHCENISKTKNKRIYLNAGTGYDCAGHSRRTSCLRRVRTIVNSSTSFIFGLTLPTGSTKDYISITIDEKKRRRTLNKLKSLLFGRRCKCENVEIESISTTINTK